MSTSVKTWIKFTKNRDGKELKLRILELPIEKFDDIMFDFLFQYFVPDEPLHIASSKFLNSINTGQF